MSKYILLLYYFTYFFNTNVFAYNDNIINIDSRKGLLSDIVYYGLQSKFTNLYWFATSNGLVSYDGCSFENYETRNPFFGLSTLKIIEDRIGRIWFYTSGGNIVVYDGYYFREIAFNSNILLKLRKGFIADSWETQEGIFFIISEFTNKKTYSLVQIRVIGDIYYPSIVPWDNEDHDNLVIYRHNKIPVLIIDLKQSIEYFKISDNLGFYNKNGIVAIFKDSLYQKYNSLKTLQNVQVQDNKIIVSCYDEIIIMNMKYEILFKRTGFPMVTSCFYDNSNNLIATTRGAGIKVEPVVPFPRLIVSNLNGVLAIKYRNQFLYYSDKLFNLYRIKISTKKVETIKKNQEKDFSDSRIYYWNSIFFNKRKFTISDGIYQSSKVEYIPFQLYLFNKQSLYISTGYADVKIIDPKGKKIKTLFYGRRVYDAKIDSGGILWVATNSGLYRGRIDISQNWTIKQFDVFFSGNLTERINIIDDKIFVLINKKRIGLVNQEYIQDDILAGTIISNKLISNYRFVNNQTVIISTNSGLGYTNFDLSNQTFTVRNTRFINFFSPYSNKIVDFDIENNLVFFATNESIYSINKDYWKSHTAQSKCYIENVNTGKRIINSIEINANTNIEFSNDESTLDFNIINSYFNKSPVDGLYRYFLIYNKDTLAAQYSRLSGIKFYNLKFGNYKLVIQGKNLFNEWGPKTSLNFYINPKFTETNRFIFLVTILTISIIFFFVYLLFANKNKLILNEKLELENENYQLQLLKSQMNPHFLFNSLNSLKGLIYLNRRDIALKYTDKLSIFLRSILSINNDLLAKIEVELGVIEHYIEVERIRLGCIIELDISFPNELRNFLIPSNILQPIVENSIKHGMLKEKEKFDIWVNIKKNTEYLELTIIDNGIGIKESNSNTSFSIKAIEKRIDKFNNGKINKGFELKNFIINDKIVGAIVVLRLLIYENPNTRR